MATLFKADQTRRIDLEGVGPTPRPTDIDQAQSGFRVLRTLRIYRFEPPAVIHGHAEEDEVLIVVLDGEIELQMRSEHWARNGSRFLLRAPLAADSIPCAAYLPPHGEYSLAPRTGADVAYARALPTGARAPEIFSSSPRRNGTGPSLLLDQSTYAERLRCQLWHVETLERGASLAPADGPAATAETLIHVRSTPARAVTLEAPGLATVVLDSWDTVGLSPGELAQLRTSARSSVMSLVVSAQ